MLTKSEYQLAKSCPKKLVYKRAGYPQASDESDFMSFLSEKGDMVGELARLWWMAEHSCVDCQNRAVSIEEIRACDFGVFFEVPLKANGLYCRVDILVKNGDQIDLIEVKSKATGLKRAVDSLKDELVDVTFQYHVAQQVFKGYVLTPFLMTPNKEFSANQDGMLFWAEDFTQEEVAKKLFDLDFFNLDSVGDQVQSLLQSEIMSIEHVVKMLQTGVFEAPLGKHCAHCEFRTPTVSLNGFGECWAKCELPENNIFDLYHGGSMKTPEGTFLIDDLISQGRLALSDIQESELRNKKGELSSRGVRQVLQIVKTRQGQEWHGPTLVDDISSLEYPLFFIDFETYSSTVPLYKGQSPNAVLPFQWSCHKIERPGADLQHYSWLHGLDGPLHVDPTVGFAKSLALLLGDKGSVLVWSSYEKRVVSSVSEVLKQSIPNREWLWTLLDRQFGLNAGRLVDMMDLAERGYFHPRMKGKLSIKAVLPAVLSAQSTEVCVPVKVNNESVTLSTTDPYTELGQIMEARLGAAITNGSQAIIAYEEMHRLYRQSMDYSATGKALQSYCELDTMAMVVIFNHWVNRINHDQIQ